MKAHVLKYGFPNVGLRKDDLNMKRLVKMFVIMMLSLIMLLATCCTRASISIAEKKKTIEVIAKLKDGDFWKTVKLGAEAAASEFNINVNFAAPSNEKEIDVQIGMVKDAINRKVDAIVLAACDYKQLVEAAEKAIDSGIPVIIIDSALDSNKVASFIATDNVAAGRNVGAKLVELIGRKGNIGVISFVKGSATADQRERGFLEAIDNYPEIKVLETEYCASDTELAEKLTLEMLNKHSNLDAVVALNGPSVVGAANAIHKLNLGGKVKIVGVDCYPEAINFIEEGVIQATIVQNPYSMGYLGVKHALEVIDKKSVPKYVDTGSKVIDKRNMYLPENQKLLFPFVN